MCLVTQSCLTLCNPMDCRLLHPWGFSRQEHWSGLPCPPPGYLPDPGIDPGSPGLQAYSLPSEPPEKSKSLSHVWLFGTPWNSPWNSPGQNSGVSSHSLLQGIFPTQGSNPGLPHCRWILYQLSHQGSPRILECVDYSFSRGSSQPRDQTQVSCIAGFFTSGATRKEWG